MAFTFAVCNAGSERWLIDEVTRGAPGTRAAYQRKGLVTFKHEDETPIVHPVLARVLGSSLGLARDVDDVMAKIGGIDGPHRLHVYARDDGPDGPTPEAAQMVARLEAELRTARELKAGARADRGERVLDVVVAGDAEILVGMHTQGEGWRVPGGRPRVDVPEDAPSRAFAKLEEALAWSELELRAGETAVELGSAPGGAALALVRRGVTVQAIDPAALHPGVLAFEGPGGARVRQLQMRAEAVKKNQLPRGASLLLCDVNVAPPVILRVVDSFVRWLRPSLRAAILTLKLNDPKMVAAIPQFVDRIRSMGLEPRATQLPSNRREICVVALAKRA